MKKLTPPERPSQPGEVWKPIEGFEKQYEVSNCGRVWSKRREVNAGHTTRIAGGELRKPVLNEELGYYVIMLKKGGTTKTEYVHALVATAFLGVRPSGYTVNHIDGDKTNNHVANLEWVSRSENMQHGFQNGLIAKGEDRDQAKLTNDEVREIRERYQSEDIVQWKLADQYDVCQQLISEIVRHERWTHVD